MIGLVFRITLTDSVTLGYNNVKNSTCYDILTCHRTVLTLFFKLYLGLNSELKASLEGVYPSL